MIYLSMFGTGGILVEDMDIHGMEDAITLD